MGEFPHVTVDALTNFQCVETASHAFQLVRKIDVVQLQSFRDHEYNMYLRSCPADSLLSEKQCRMAYSMEFYYLHVHEFLCSETLRVRAFRHCFQDSQFVPLVHPSVLKTPAEQTSAAACLRNVVTVVFVQHRLT
jgi:hypothetical protein